MMSFSEYGAMADDSRSSMRTNGNRNSNQASDESILKRLVSELGVGEALNDKLSEWKDTWRREEIHIGVIGPSRVGKSTHINAHLGLRSGKPGAAVTSATRQCTRKCTAYKHPRNENILLWDIPGLNTLDYTREEYTKLISIDQYDFFLILTENVFTDDTKWLTDEIQDRGKRFYLVRTKVDYSISESLHDGPSMTTNMVLREIRQSLDADLRRMGFDVDKFKVYLVNNKNKAQFDFPSLEADICEDSVELFQQEALLITLRSYNKELVQSKYELFKRRTLYIGLGSAAGGAVPIPGVSASVDTCLIIEETLCYFFGFSLDKNSIANLEDICEKRRGEIENNLQTMLRANYPLLYAIREETPANFQTFRVAKELAPAVSKNLAEILVKQLGISAVSEGMEMSAKLLIPVFGIAIAASLSFAVTKYQLNLILDNMKDVALYVSNIYTDEQRKRMNTFAVDQE